jgi:hypothetical protein
MQSAFGITELSLIFPRPSQLSLILIAAFIFLEQNDRSIFIAGIMEEIFSLLRLIHLIIS